LTEETSESAAASPAAAMAVERAVLDSCPIIEWSGSVWRCHGQRYRGDDAAGSLRVTGRYHRGADKFPPSQTWPALYAGLAVHVALGERLRHTRSIAKLKHWRISHLHVELSAVLDLCSPTGCDAMRLPNPELPDLCHPADYTVTHAIAGAAREVAEAMRAPSCTQFPEGNLIIFLDRVRSTSRLEVVHSNDPELQIDWDRYR
jgi:hypothetical protein